VSMRGKGNLQPVGNGHTAAVMLLETILAKEAKSRFDLWWKTPRLS